MAEKCLCSSGVTQCSFTDSETLPREEMTPCLQLDQLWLTELAEHWVHLKTTNPIESTFATVRLRTKVTKGAGSAPAGIAMAF